MKISRYKKAAGAPSLHKTSQPPPRTIMPLFDQLATLTAPAANTTGQAKTADRSSTALNNTAKRPVPNRPQNWV